jgi:hypothetical protein
MKRYDAEKNSRLVYRLLSLGMAGAVLHIGAHPDDEDIGLLAYLSSKFGEWLFWGQVLQSYFFNFISSVAPPSSPHGSL